MTRHPLGGLLRSTARLARGNQLKTENKSGKNDAAGNMTYDATSGLNYTFDQENRLTGADGYIYTYDSDGNRVRKSNGNLAANGTLYWAMTPAWWRKPILAGTTKSEYIFFDGERVARRDGATGAGGVFYYFSDHLKTASVITDSAGVIKAESDYYPWGGELQFVNNDSNDYKFTGKKRDIETRSRLLRRVILLERTGVPSVLPILVLKPGFNRRFACVRVLCVVCVPPLLLKPVNRHPSFLRALCAFRG
jgi:hypothetical protein